MANMGAGESDQNASSHLKVQIREAPVFRHLQIQQPHLCTASPSDSRR